MALTSGTKLGPYEIKSPLGAGGMGEVYRGFDTRLERTVAIKVLNSALAATPDLKVRFEREAKIISQLNHPHICTLYDVGSHQDTEYLVMEYLEGESLADRLRRGPLPLPELLKIGCAIADALDRAHRAGIVHRDLKPGNVMLTKSGAKLLDFGLAKPAAMGAVAGGSAAPLLSAALTMTAPSPRDSPLTQHGAFIGTVQYMSPEQIQGLEADARSDIFAFGAMLYEMATARRAFEGKSQMSVASAILEKEIESISARDQASPPALDRIIATCVAKDPEERFASAHDVKLELTWLAATPRKQQAEVQTFATPRRMVPVLLAVAILVAATAAAAAYWLASRKAAPVVQAVIAMPDKLVLDATGDFAGPAVISPNGTAIAFSAHMSGSTRALWVRRLAEPTAQRLEGTEEASFPFWSPDSREIAFFSHGRLNKIGASGGPILALADAPSARGGSWGKSNVILFEPDFQSALMRVSTEGGPVTAAAVIDATRHTTHRWPWFLPDGKHFLFLATNHNGGNRDQNGVYFGSLDSNQTSLVVASDAGAQFANGNLLFHSQNALMAQPFDTSTGKLSGEASVVVDHVANDIGIWRSIFSVSDTGTLVFQGGEALTGSELVFVDRSGKDLGRLGERIRYASMRPSPDGKRLAVAIGGQKGDLWIFDLVRGGAATRFTFEPGTVENPAWSPDGTEIYYNVFPGSDSDRVAISSSSANIYAKRADGSGASRLVVQEPPVGNVRVRPAAMSPQIEPGGKNLLYIRRQGPVGNTVVSIDASGAGQSKTVVAPGSPQSNIIDFRLSPDGHWLAYTTNESGRTEVYLTPYPNTAAGKWQVSSNGGQFVTWRGDSHELFYFGINNQVYSVPFDGRELPPRIGVPQVLFAIPNTAFNGFYEIMPDGKRLLLNRVPEQTSTPISIVLNWPETLKK